MTRVATNSTLPRHATLHHAVLRHPAQHPGGDRRQNIHEAVADLLGLREAQRAGRWPAGRQASVQKKLPERWPARQRLLER
jgi:hypothetical protein